MPLKGIEGYLSVSWAQTVRDTTCFFELRGAFSNMVFTVFSLFCQAAGENKILWYAYKLASFNRCNSNNKTGLRLRITFAKNQISRIPNFTRIGGAELSEKLLPLG